MEENRVFYEATNKFVGYLTDKVTEHVNLGFQKELLSYHKSFDAHDLFRELDTDNNGFISSAEMGAYFADDEDFAGFNWENLVKYWSSGSNDKLSFADLQVGLSAYPGPRPAGFPRGSYARHNDDDQKKSQDKSWRSQLKLVIYLTGPNANKAEEAPAILNEEESKLLWQSLDNYDYGYISSNALQRWLGDFANFDLPVDKVHFLYDCFDTRESMGRITHAQF
jgi:hypothetical protein